MDLLQFSFVCLKGFDTSLCFISFNIPSGVTFQFCRSITAYCDGSFRNHFFFHRINPWNSYDFFKWGGIDLHLIFFTLYRDVVAPFAKWLWTNEILHNKILLYFIHFLWELTTCVVYNISTYEKLIVLESSKWTRISTSLQVLGLYIPCSPRFCHLL